MESKKCPTKFETFRSNFILVDIFQDNVILGSQNGSIEFDFQCFAKYLALL
jgi:hypothetical protein